MFGRERPPGYVEIPGRKILIVVLVFIGIGLYFLSEMTVQRMDNSSKGEALEYGQKPRVANRGFITHIDGGVIPMTERPSHGDRSTDNGTPKNVNGQEISTITNTTSRSDPPPKVVMHDDRISMIDASYRDDSSALGASHKGAVSSFEEEDVSNLSPQDLRKKLDKDIEKARLLALAEAEQARLKRELEIYYKEEDGIALEISSHTSPNGENPKISGNKDEERPSIAQRYLESLMGKGGSSKKEDVNLASVVGKDDVVSVRKASVDNRRIRKGASIPAILNEPIDSELPGLVTATVTHPVFDTDTGQEELIPAYSQLVGTYQTEKVGGKRLGVIWSELRLPDGRTIELGGMPAADQSGVSGVPAKRESQFFRALGAAALISVVTAGMESVSRSGSKDDERFESIYRQEVARQVLGLGAKVLDRAMSVSDRFRTKAGEGIVVRVTRDIVFEE